MTTYPVRRPAVARGTPLRIRPSMGPARCLLERVGQHVWRYRLAWYASAAAAVAAALQFGLDHRLHF